MGTFWAELKLVQSDSYFKVHMYLVFFAFGGFPGFNGLIHEQYTYVCVYKYVRQTLFLGNLEDDFAPIRDIIKNIH